MIATKYFLSIHGKIWILAEEMSASFWMESFPKPYVRFLGIRSYCHGQNANVWSPAFLHSSCILGFVIWTQKLILILARSRARIEPYFVYLSIQVVMQELVFPIIATGVLFAEELPFLMVPDWLAYFVCVKHKHWQWCVVVKFAISYSLACRMNSSCSVGGAIGNEFSKICVKLISPMRNLLPCCSRSSFEVCL